MSPLPLTAFKIFLHVTTTLSFDYNIPWCGFIFVLFVISLISCICGFMGFSKFGKIVAIIFPSIFFLSPFSLTSRSPIP